MIAYKEVVLKDNEFISPFMWGEAKLVYKLGEKVIIPSWLANNGLFPFVYHNIPDKTIGIILECEVEDPVPLPIPCEWHSLSIGVITQKEIDPSLYFGKSVFSYKSITPIRIL